MSSISTRPNGHNWVFFAFGGKRHTVRLGGVSRRDAQDFQRRLDRLIETRNLGLTIEPALRQWLLTLGERPHRALAKAGLVSTRAATTIEDLNEAYLKALKRKEAKPSTIANAKVVCNNLTAYFHGRKIGDVTRDDADAFRAWMLSSGGKGGTKLARTTVSRRCRRCREIFGLAVEEGWIEKNPFGKMRKWSEVDNSRDAYISTKIVDKLIDAATDVELRLLLALVRYCGLRCPSEVTPLRWEWFDWDAGTFRARAPKTEHHEGQASREIPVFESVAEYVAEAWEAAHAGQTLVFPNYQITNAAITGRLQRLCRTAGVDCWPKPWVNLRASCERDLLKKYPIDQAAAWLGHSPETALRHYNRVVKEQQTRQAGVSRASGSKSGVQPEAKGEVPYRSAKGKNGTL